MNVRILGRVSNVVPKKTLFVRNRSHLPSMTPDRKEQEARAVQLPPVPQQQTMAKLSLNATRSERGQHVNER